MTDDRTTRDIEILLEQLASEDWQTRRRAARDLGVTAADIDHELTQLLASEHAGERNAAIKALIKRGTHALPALYESLRSEDEDVRNFSAVALGNIGERESVPVLMGAFENEKDDNVRYMIVEALGRVGDAAAVPLLAGLMTEDMWCGAAAADALGAIGGPEAVRLLLAQLDNPMLGAIAATSLGRTGDLRALVPLVEAAIADDGGMALMYLDAAAATMRGTEARFAPILDAARGRIAPEAREALANLIVDSLDCAADRVRMVALLCWLDVRSTYPQLLDLAGELDTAAVAGAHLASRLAEVRPMLETILRSFDSHAKHAVIAIASLAGEPDGTGLAIAALQDPEEDVRLEAVRALSECAGNRAREALFGILAHDDPVMRRTAAEALSHVGAVRESDGLRDIAAGSHGRGPAREARYALASSLTLDSITFASVAVDPDPTVRLAAAHALAERAHDEQWPHVVMFARDESETIRAEAARALGRMTGDHVSHLVERLLVDPHPRVRAAAAISAAACCPEMVTDHIQALFSDRDPRVVIAGLDAAGVVGLWRQADVVEGLLDSAEPDVREAALRCLVRLVPPRGCEVAVRLAVEDRSWIVRARAFRILGGNEVCGTESLLHAGLRDPERAVRIAAMEALPRLLGTRGITLLFDVLLGEDGHEEIAHALRLYGDNAVPALYRRALCDSGRGGELAASILADMATPMAYAALSRLLDVDDEPIAWIAASALVGRCPSRLAAQHSRVLRRVIPWMETDSGAA